MNSLKFAVSKLLKEHCTWDWSYYPAAEKFNTRAATQLMQLGFKRSWGAFILIRPCGLAHFLALKLPGEEMTFDEEEFRIGCIARRNPYEVCWTWEQALLALERWGCVYAEAKVEDR